MIDSFQGKYRFLSNFWDASEESGVFIMLTYEGIDYPTVEHAYQAMKSTNIAEREEIAQMQSPDDAKRAGRKVKIRSDWEHVKIGIMLDLLRLKFSIPFLREKLLATGDQELIEGNTWHDYFWGVCNGKGQNHLGRLLMQVRDELK